MLMLIRRFITHNWVLKLFSLLLATLMWFAISSENNLEISLVAPLGYQSRPPNTEITHDQVKQVSLRLRGSASLLAELSNADVTVAISLAGEEPGPKSVLLSADDHVQKPFGVEVLRIEPNRVQFDLERTLTKRVPVYPNIEGTLADGFVLGEVRVDPDSIEVTGPESSIDPLGSISTLTIRIDGASQTVRASVDLDIRDTYVQPPSWVPIEVEVEIIEVEAEGRYRVPLDPQLETGWGSDPRTLDVLVSGPASLVELFDPAAVHFTFDVEGLEGEMEVTPRVVGLPVSFTVLEFSPPRVRVSAK
jgi:YbbR domain-containing protein